MQKFFCLAAWEWARLDVCWSRFCWGGFSCSLQLHAARTVAGGDAVVGLYSTVPRGRLLHCAPGGLKPLQRQNWGKCREVLLFEAAWRLRARKQWVSQAFWSVFLTLQSILLNPWHNSVLKFVCKARNAHYMTQVEVSRSSFCLRIVVCPVALLYAQSICPTKVERSFSSKPTSALWSSPAVLRERRMQGRHWV